jgi:hypothetical protein
MYEQFTDRARKIMQLANQEAQRLDHEYIGTEHILLGLVTEGSHSASSRRNENAQETCLMGCDDRDRMLAFSVKWPSQTITLQAKGARAAPRRTTIPIRSPMRFMVLSQLSRRGSLSASSFFVARRSPNMEARPIIDDLSAFENKPHTALVLLDCDFRLDLEDELAVGGKGRAAGKSRAQGNKSASIH